MSELAVGSISHILKTAFRDVFEDSHRSEEAKIGRQLVAEAKKERALYLEQLKQYEESQESLNESSLKAQKDKSKTKTKTKEPVEATKSEIPLENFPLLNKYASIDEIIIPEESQFQFTTSFEKLSLNSNHQQLLDQKFNSIDSKIDNQKEEAQHLSHYLANQRQIALLEEESEIENLKKQGIMVGQHVPSLKSKLNLDTSKLRSFGNLSSNLVVSRDLIEQNKTETLRRTGNLPISIEAEVRDAERTRRGVVVHSDKPHYLNQTHSQDVRAETISHRFSSTLARSTERRAEARERAPSKPRRDPEQTSLTPEEKEKNYDILKNMKHKLNYLRNPRNDPGSVTSMLTRALPVSEPSDPSQTKPSVSIQKKTRSSIPESPLFVSSPSTVLFSEFVVGQTDSKLVSFRNVSALSRSLRIIPPTSQTFFLSDLIFPQNSQGGLVAPGMCVQATLSFSPSSPADYSDFVRVETEGGSYKLNIFAQREAPLLSIPSVINVGSCLVGDALSVALPCFNSGGAGSFWLLSEMEYQSANPEHINRYENWEDRGCLRMSPFTVFPMLFSLDKHDSLHLNLDFVPLTIGAFSQNFYMICDNRQITRFTVVGESKVLDVSLIEINGVEFDYQNQSMKNDVFFEDVVVGCTRSQQLVAMNDTGLSLQYQWVFVPLDSRDILRDAQEQIRLADRKLLDNTFHSTTPAFETTPEWNSRPSTALSNEIQSIDQDPQNCENCVSCEEFTLSPARGIFANEGIEHFTLNFNPKTTSISRLKAVLLLRGVPFASLPDHNQKKYLDRLLTQGHGKFPRLCSWLEELGLEAEVLEYRKRNKDISNVAKLTNLRTVLDIVRGSTSISTTDSVQDRLPSLCRWIKEILSHVELWKKRALDDEDHEIPNVIELQMYFYFQEQQISTPATNRILPTPVHKIRLNPCLVASQEDSHQILGQHQQTKPDQESGVRRNSDFALQTPLASPKPSPPDKPSFSNLSELFRTLTPEDKTLLGSIWLDTKNIEKLLGEEVCSLLNASVNHEAVSYIQEGAHSDIVCLSTNVFGSGAIQKVSVSPSVFHVPGLIPYGREFSVSVTLHNPCDSPVDLMLALEKIKVKAKSDEQETKELKILESKIQIISVSDDRLLLLPYSSATINLRLKVLLIGKFQIVIPIESTSTTFTKFDQIHISLETTRPLIRFNLPEIDIGLVGVGYEEQKILSFTNDSDIDASFIFKPLLELDVEGKIHFGKQKSKMSEGGMMSGRQSGRLSNRSSATDDDLSSSDSNHIDSTFANISILPPAGLIQAGQTMTVTVLCRAGRNPQRLRGKLECRTLNIEGDVTFSTQFISLRGEVQSPKTIMYPLAIDLGRVYVGMPAKFEFFIQNLCNLPTKFRLERPDGESSSFRINFSQQKGPLAQKETLKISAEFIALHAGIVDDLVSNKVFGLLHPLGFSLKAAAKGVQLEAVQIAPGEKPPPPLGKPTDTQFPSQGDPPDPQPITPLDFGSNIPLYQRRSLRIAIRNLSAIPTTVNLSVKKFPVVGDVDPSVLDSSSSRSPSKRSSSPGKSQMMTQTSSTNSIKSTGTQSEEAGEANRTDLLIAPWEDGENKFKSEAGMKYIAKRLQRLVDKKFLQSMLGAAYLIDPGQVELPPWGVKIVTLRTFNDIPGSYDDTLVLEYQDGSKPKALSIPLKMTIFGCPIVIEPNTVGVTKIRRTEGTEPQASLSLEEESKDSCQQLLKMGSACVNSEPLIRDFVVKNNGSVPGKLKWKIRSIASRVNGPLKLEFKVQPNGRIKSHLIFWDDVEKDSPFTIEPTSSVVKPYSTKRFRVTLFRTQEPGKLRAMLTGIVNFDNSLSQPSLDLQSTSLSASLSGSSLVSSSSSQEARKDGNYVLNMMVEGEFIHPTVSIEKVVYKIPDNPTFPQHSGLEMRSHASSLFSKGMKASDLCCRPISFLNPLDFSLIFSASVEGPFSLLSHSADSKEETQAQGSATLFSSITKPSGTISGSSIGRTLNLLPNTSSTVVLAFNPRKDLRDTLSQPVSTFSGTERSTTESGKLILSFPTGQSLHLPINVLISTPFLAASSPKLYFGTCLVKQSCSGTLLLSNQTDVPAKWSVSHVPGAGAGHRQTAIRVKGFEVKGEERDDPSVFQISPQEGEVIGPTVSVSAAMAAPPKDLNRSSESVVPVRSSSLSWASQTFSLHDSLSKKHSEHHQFAADSIFPQPLSISFRPSQNVRYSSRFRFVCEFGNTFDVILQGIGTHNEHEHSPISPVPK